MIEPASERSGNSLFTVCRKERTGSICVLSCRSVNVSGSARSDYHRRSLASDYGFARRGLSYLAWLVTAYSLQQPWLLRSMDAWRRIRAKAHAIVGALPICRRLGCVRACPHPFHSDLCSRAARFWRWQSDDPGASTPRRSSFSKREGKNPGMAGSQSKEHGHHLQDRLKVWFIDVAKSSNRSRVGIREGGK